jgi:predicted site-specific integrase-resolvase
MEEQKWYTYEQIILMLGICKQTLNNWRKNGTIRYRKLTKKTFLYQLPETKIIQKNELSKNL